MFASGLVHPDEELFHLDQKVVQVTTWVASAFAIALTAVGIVGNDEQSLIQMITPASVALVGWYMIHRSRPNVAFQLLVGMAGVGFMAVAVDTHLARDPQLALIAMGVVGALFARRHLAAFIVITALALATVGFLHGEGLTGTEQVQNAFGAVGTYIFLTWLLLWLKRRWMDGQRALRELIKSKDELVASVSHELRTPMTTVVGLSRELDERFNDFDGTEVAEFLALIVQESTDVANILEDLLVAARADVGTLALDMQTTDLCDEIDLAMKTAPGCAVEKDPSLGRLHVLADGGRVRQILRNLVGNATRYGGPNVRVVIERRGSLAAVAVCDDGEPIPAADRDRIFQPYHGLRGSSAIPGSVGLGLTISRELARLMGGDLTYTFDGGESVFTLTLPLAVVAETRRGAAVEVTPVAI